MSPFTKIGQFKYWTNLLDARGTSTHFDKASDELREKSSETNNAGYGAWMAGRRAGEYASFAMQQKRQIHGTALVANWVPVCSCALVADFEIENPDGNENWLYASEGHLDNELGAVVTAFYIRHYSAETQKWPLHFFCQICSALEPADLTGDDKLDAILLADFRELHNHEEISEESN